MVVWRLRLRLGIVLCLFVWFRKPRERELDIMLMEYDT